MRVSADHAEIFDEGFRVGVRGNPTDADEDAVSGAFRSEAHP
jgi:hypothetical protein